MIVSHTLCRTARSSIVHRTESVSVMGHVRLAAVCSTRSDQRRRSFFVHISSFWSAVLQDVLSSLTCYCGSQVFATIHCPGTVLTLTTKFATTMYRQIDKTQKANATTNKPSWRSSHTNRNLNETKRKACTKPILPSSPVKTAHTKH